MKVMQPFQGSGLGMRFTQGSRSFLAATAGLNDVIPLG
jgi:hypothetical protein